MVLQDRNNKGHSKDARVGEGGGVRAGLRPAPRLWMPTASAAGQRSQRCVSSWTSYSWSARLFQCVQIFLYLLQLKATFSSVVSWRRRVVEKTSQTKVW